MVNDPLESSSSDVLYGIGVNEEDDVDNYDDFEEDDDEEDVDFFGETKVDSGKVSKKTFSNMYHGKARKHRNNLSGYTKKRRGKVCKMNICNKLPTGKARRCCNTCPTGDPNISGKSCKYGVCKVLPAWDARRRCNKCERGVFYGKGDGNICII